MKAFLKKIVVFILRVESQLVLKKYKPKIVAITGSVGKTSTKDAVYAVLAPFAYVRKSEKSYNSEIGLPLTILGCENAWSNPIAWLENIARAFWLIIWPHSYPEWLVLEVGIGKPGDMRRTASWLRTDVVIITAIGETPVHIEFFASRKHLVEEKSGLIKTLKKGGVLVLNADDKDVASMRDLARNPKKPQGEEKARHPVVTYGFDKNADIVCSGDSIFYNEAGLPDGVIFRIDSEGKSFPVVIEGVFGRNHVYAALGALTLALILKFNMLTATHALKNYEVPPGRMRLLQGIHGSLIIDDTYNSSPLASQSALNILREIKLKENSENHARKIAVLGDMLELGRHTVEAHKALGKLARETLVATSDMLITVGQRAKTIKEGALEAGLNKENIMEFSNSREAGEFVRTFVKEGDLVLVKGSQGVRMERVVEAILLDQENRKNLLVRQEEKWQNKN